MSLILRNDSDTTITLGELNKSISRLGNDLKKVSSGTRINSASDGTSEYAISEKMKTMVRSLGQDIENSKKGIDLVNMAEKGISSIIDELRNMKKMAINSANDHNNDQDRATIQKEFVSRMEEINDIVATTNYNGTDCQAKCNAFEK